MDDPLILFSLSVMGAAALGVLLGWVHLLVWPVDIGAHHIHRPVEPRLNRDAPARRHTSGSDS